MSATIQLRTLDDEILTALGTVEVDGSAVLVGDGVMPLDSGWGVNSPNTPGQVFTPYVVLTTMTATPAADSGSIQNPQQDWHIPYVVQSFGVSRAQCRWMSDHTREALAALKDEIFALGDGNYKVQQVWTGSMGGVSRVPQTDPAYYVEPDGVTLWIAKRRT